MFPRYVLWIHLYMKLVGMATNGEHNGLRMRGLTRPLHVLQVRAEARRAVTAIHVKTLLAMLTPKGM